MTIWMLTALIGCGEKDDSGEPTAETTESTAETEAGCAIWVSCCQHTCGTEAEYAQWVKDDIDCSQECDSASPGPLTESCVIDDDASTCAWAP